MAEAALNPLKLGFWTGLLRDTTQLIVIAMIASIAMLVIPMRVEILDFVQIVSIILSLIIMITVINSKSALDFSIFPTLLLFTTLFRLAINVSSTRLILTEGINFQGKVITAFADFVIGNNIVVGVIVFIIITAVMFMVITKGSTRVSEVSARFQLDAMPQKQLAIDTELSQGLIDEKQAMQRREAIQEEATFYGNMDGASKFVSGDIKVGILITVVNIIGGLITGMAMRGEDFNSALQGYVILSIGDGLVAQIPALLISTAAGIIVTKSTSKLGLGLDVKGQLFSNPMSLYISGGFVFLLSFLPGFPLIVFWIVAGCLFYLGYYISRSQKEDKLKDELEHEKEDIEKEDLSTPEKMVDLVQVDALEIELGYSLIPLVDKNAGGDLLDRIKKSRRQIVMEYGLIVPQVRITDNMQLDPEEYAIKLNGDTIGGDHLKMDSLLALNTGGTTNGLEGEKTTEPVFGLPAYWIAEEQKEKAEHLGYTVFDAPTIVATHLTELIKRHGGDLMGRKEVKNILDSVQKRNPIIIEEMNKLNVKTGDVQKVLQGLLNEGISIRNIETILEVICDHAGAYSSVEQLIEWVRAKLQRQISSRFSDGSKNIHVVVFSPELERELIGLVAEGDASYAINLSPGALSNLVSRTGEKIRLVSEKGYNPILITDATMRRAIYNVLSRTYPNLGVMAYSEVAEGYNLDVLERI